MEPKKINLPLAGSECCGGNNAASDSGCCDVPVSPNGDTISTKEQAVRERYSAASQERKDELCCPISYPTELLEAIPQEVIEKDYGCGDPTPFVRPGDTVLDLGSGAGKLCFISAQLTGPQGQVIGVDCNSDMLEVARRNNEIFAETVGFENVEFRCGMIQDLQLDLELLTERLSDVDRASVDGLLEQRRIEQTLRDQFRMIPDNSVDCVISNCVLNLVRPEDRVQLFSEIYRVLRDGGRAAISDIVSDEDVPESMQNDGELWSGCISGAWRDDRFVDEFQKIGFYGIEIANWSEEPWQVINGIEFRSMTVVAHKGKEGSCLEANQAVIYAGPFSQVVDDDGSTYRRGQRTAVCNKTFQLLSRKPYADAFIRLEPKEAVPLESAQEFDCNVDQVREASVTKGGNQVVRQESSGGACGPGCC